VCVCVCVGFYVCVSTLGPFYLRAMSTACVSVIACVCVCACIGEHHNISHCFGGWYIGTSLQSPCLVLCMFSFGLRLLGSPD